MGSGLAAPIGECSNLNPTQLITVSYGNGFMFRAIDAQKVKDLIQSLRSNKASIGIPNKCIKPAVNHISEEGLILHYSEAR